MDTNSDTAPTVDAEDRLAIAELFSRYAFHFDRNEPDEVAALFTRDATVDYGPDVPPIRGRDQFEAQIRPGLESIFAATSHHVSNVMVQASSPDLAEAIAYVYAWHRYVDGSPDGHLWGQYHATVRREPDAWRFERLRLETVALTDFHRERMHQVARRPSPGRRTTPD